MRRKLILPMLIIFVGSILPACNNLNVRLNTDVAFDSIKKIRDAETKFKKQTGAYGTLKELSEVRLIDSSLASGTYYGHKYEVRAKKNSYVAVTVPIEYGENAYHGTGYVSLYVDETGVVRGGDRKGAEANVNDEAIGKQQ